MSCKLYSLTTLHNDILVIIAHLYGPPHGIYSERPPEFQLHVGGDVGAPLVLAVPAGEEHADGLSAERHVRDHVCVTEHPVAVGLRLPQTGRDGAGGEHLLAVAVACLRHLNHAQVVLAVQPPYEVDDVRAGEPAVAEHITELYAVLHAALYHFLHQLCLAHDALLLAAGRLSILTLHRLVLAGGLPAVQAEVSLLVLTAEGDVHQQLADAVAQAAE